ncbi:MAG: sortase [Chloroflexi bacterium]|nr:sortase [Chloroflexota bacterium]
MSAIPRKRRITARAGLALVALGGLLLAAVGGYYILSVYAYSRLSGLSAAAAPDVLNRDFPQGWRRLETERLPGDGARSAPGGVQDGEDRRAQDGPVVELYPTPAPGASPVASSSSAGARVPAQPAGGLRSVRWDDLPRTIGETPPARWIQIPAIGVDSKVVELGTVWVDGKLEWETPKWAVGHHKGTANPGERSNMVLSGHISSPLLREGEVFKRLPEIPKLLDSGQIVDVIVSTEDTRFLYRVVRWELVKPEQLDVFAQMSEPTVTLITCYPDFAYWDRLIITGRLVGIAPVPR